METFSKPYRPWGLSVEERDALTEMCSGPLEIIVTLQLDGHSNHEIAWVLNYYGFKNPKTGRKWNPTGVKFAHKKSKEPLCKLLGPVLGPKPRPKPKGKVKKLWNHLLSDSKNDFDGLRGQVAPFLTSSEPSE